MNKDRKHIRLPNHDYSSDGEYFITICTHNRECFFGKIENDEMILNEIGLVANKYLKEIPGHFSHAQLDEFIVMPNHVHCILALETKIVAPDGTVNAGTSHVETSYMMSPQRNGFSKPVKGSVSVIIQQYKAAVKRWCNANKHEYFEWQSRFHDHIIRNAKSYEKIKIISLIIQRIGMMIHYTRRDIIYDVHRVESRVGASYMMSTNCMYVLHGTSHVMSLQCKNRIRFPVFIL